MRQFLRDDFAPFAEAHEYVLLHRQIAFEEIRHRRRRNAQHRLRNRGDQFLGQGDCGLVLAEKHRAVDREVEIVDDVDQVDARIVRISEEPAVGRQRLLVIEQNVIVVPAQHVEMRRHVDEVTGIGDDLAQPVAGPQCYLRKRRHLHQVDIEVQQARVIPCRRDFVESIFQHLPAFLGARSRRRARGQVPHLPRRLVHQRLGKHRPDFEIVRMGGEDLSHFLCVGLVPRRHILDRLTLRIARGERLDHRPLERACLSGMRQRGLHGIVRCRQCHLPAIPVVANPGQIVVGARGIADAPVRHGAFAVVLQRLLKALDRLGMVEAEQPVQSAVEPELGIGRRRRDFAAIRAKIKIGHTHFPYLHDHLAKRPCRKHAAANEADSRRRMLTSTRSHSVPVFGRYLE